jgi:hypothetical protein
MPCSSKPCTHPTPLTKSGKPNRYPSLWEQHVSPPKKSIEAHKKFSFAQCLWAQCPSNPTWETLFWIKTCGWGLDFLNTFIAFFELSKH